MTNSHFYTNSYVRVRSDVFKFKESKSQFYDMLYKYSKIVPETILEKMVYNEDELLFRQKTLIQKKLLTCKKQAAILPEKLAVEMETILKQKYPSDYVYVGKNVLFQDGVYFGFGSKYKDILPIPSKNILNRYAGYKTAGFLTWWEKYMDFIARIRRQRGNYTNIVESRSATLSGNISVIFIVFAGGILISIVGFVYEQYLLHIFSNPRYIYFKGKHFLGQICTLWHNFHKKLNLLLKEKIKYIKDNARPHVVKIN